MGTVIRAAGFLVIAGAFTWLQLRSSKKNADAELRAFASTVVAPMTTEVRQWLSTQLARRSTYPALGALWGATAANIPLTPGWHELPWYWFAVLIGVGIGMTAGALVAGYRTPPLLEGTLRTVDPVRRRVHDYFNGSHVLRLRLAVVLSAGSFVLAGAIAASSDTASTRRALLGCGLGALLVVAHYWVTAAVITRPMVTSTPAGLVWQKALIAKAVEPMPDRAFLVAVFSAVIALVVAVEEYRVLPLSVLMFSACFALLVAAAMAAVILSDRRDRQRSRMRVPSERSTP